MPPPSSIGPYTIQQEYSRGKIASVLKALDSRTQEPVVIKLFSSECLSDPSIRGRYQRESQLINSLSLPAIVPVREFAEQDGQPYIVMPLMAGGSLAQRLANGPISLAEAIDVIKSLASSLDAVHELGIVHKNIKPENILFDADGRSYLTDFGTIDFARAFAGERGNVLLGPPAYISPEQAQGQTELDGRSDTYMLGVVLFEMLTGQLPYRADTVISMATQHSIHPVPSLTSIRHELPDAWDIVVSRALAKDPKERFATMLELVDALEHPEQVVPVLSNNEISRMPRPFLADVSGAQPKPALGLLDEKAPEAALPRSPEPRQRRPWVWIMTGVLVLAALAGLGYQFRDFLLPLDQSSPTVGSAQSNLIPSATADVSEIIPATLVPSPNPTQTAVEIDTATPSPTILVTQQATATEQVLPTVPLPTSTALLPTPIPPSIYTLQYNDTLFAIASQFHVDMAELIGVNSLQCDSRLPAGVDLVIPPAVYIPYQQPEVAISSENLESINLHYILDCVQNVRSLDFSPDGQILAVASGSHVYLYQVAGWKPFVQLKGHSATVNAVDFSPDGQYVVTGADDATVRIWQVSNGELLVTMRGHTNQITDVAFSPGGQIIVSAARDNTARLWQVDGTPLQTLGGYAAFSAAFSPDGQILAVGYIASVGLYNVDDLSLIGRLDSADVARNLTFSPDGSLLASSSDIWQVAERRLLYHLQSSGDATAFTMDGQILVVGRNMWRVTSGQRVKQLKSPIPENPRTNDVWDSLAMSPDGGLLAWGMPDGLHIWGLPDGLAPAAGDSTSSYIVQPGDTLYNISTAFQVPLKSLLQQNNLVCGSPIFASQRLIVPSGVSLSTAAFPSEPISVENLLTIKSLRLLTMDCVKLTSGLYFSPDGNTLISGGALWDVNTSAMLIQASSVPLRFDGTPETNLVSPLMIFAPVGQMVALRVNNQIELWEISTGRLLRTLQGHTDLITSLAFSPDGQTLASGSGTEEKIIRLWNVADGRQIQTLDGFTVSGLSFTSDGQFIIAEGGNAVRVWRLSDGTLLHTLQGVIGNVSISPDDSMLAFTSCTRFVSDTCASELVSLYQISAGNVSASLMGIDEQIESIKFSPDGQILGAASGNGIILWRVSDRVVLHRLIISGRADRMLDLFFSPDSSLLISSDENGMMRFWDVTNGTPLRSEAGINLSSLAFSSDGKMMAILANGTIQLWGRP